MGDLTYTLELSWQALQAWRARQLIIAVSAAAATWLIVGFVTVLIPNPLFMRDIEPEPWSYPLWFVMAVLTGLLLATYVRPPGLERRASKVHGRSNRTAPGGIGVMVAWFAIGCPVCNKIAVAILGYTGALTWFAPVQPVLAAGSVVLLVWALLRRLRGQVICPVSAQEAAMRDEANRPITNNR